MTYKPSQRSSRRMYLATILIAVFLGFYGIAKYTDFAQPVLCHFQLFSPSNQLIEGQFHIGTDWTEIELKTPLKPAANIQELVLMVQPDKANPTSFGGDEELSSFGISAGRMVLPANQGDVWFDVRLIDQAGKAISLYVSGTNSVHTGVSGFSDAELQYIGLGYSLVSDRWNKAFFPENASFQKVEVRASQPFTLDAIRWFADYHYYQPCKTYADVPEERVFNFDVPQPPLTRPEVPGWPKAGG